MFSIIIPVYNKAPYLQKAINSVVSQTFQEFELIVVNDGSKDNSLEVLQSINASLTKPFILIDQANAGVSTARNNGVMMAKYDYIAFLDADDWWEATFLEEMKGLIQEYPKAGIYGSSYYKVKNNQYICSSIGVEEGFQKGYINYFQAYTNSLWMPLWTGATVVSKKQFIDKQGFKPHLKLGEDFDLWVRIALNSPVALLNKPLAYYNQDVDVAQRGVVLDKIYLPSEHFIFNLDYLNAYIGSQPLLQGMLDKQRIYCLKRYHLLQKHIPEFNAEMRKINFSQVPFKDKLFYATPSVILRFLFRYKTYLSQIKSRLMR